MKRTHQGFPEQIAKAMARHRAETGHEQLEGPAVGKQTPASVPPTNTAVMPVRPVRSPNAEPAEIPITRSIVAESAPPRNYSGPAIDELRRRRARRRALFVLVCLLLTGLAFVPVGNELILPAAVVAYGEEAIVLSPAVGTVKEVSVAVGDKVRRGDRLLLIEPSAPVALVAERRDWNTLKIREARLLAQIAGRDSFASPDGLFNFEVGPDPNSVVYEQKRLLEQGLREDRATLEPLEESIESLEKDLAEAESNKAAVEKQLATTEARRREAAALRDQHVVYEDGVYTEQLVGTLEQMSKNLRGHAAKHGEAVEKAAASLASAREALAQRRLERADALASELGWVRGEMARSSVRLTTMAGLHSPVEVRSAWTGTVQHIAAPLDDGRVQSGAELLTLHVPSEKAILEALLPSYDRERIRVGQPARVTFPYPGKDRSVEYAGVVRSVAPSRGQLTYVQVEIDTPREDNSAYNELAGGLRGEVVLRSREQALRQHLWRWLRRQAESFDSQALTTAIGALFDRGWSAISALQH